VSADDTPRQYAERTAPRRPEDCPTPTGPEGWRQNDGSHCETPQALIEWAKSQISYAELRRENAVLGLLAEGQSVADVAKAAGISEKRVREIRDHDQHTQQRLDYSRAYYERHPDRVRDEWYPVEDGDPELPAGTGFGTRTRKRDQ
jgi:hypothetical protein